MTAGIAAPVAGPVLTEFVLAHRAEPWPTRGASPARAGKLYDSYVEFAEAAGLRSHGRVRRGGDPDEPLLSQRDFSIALGSLGYGTEAKNENRRYYTSLLEATREETAREWAIEVVKAKVELDLLTREEAAHMTAFDHGTTRVQVFETWTDFEGKPIPREAIEGGPVFEDVPNPCRCDMFERAAHIREAIRPELDAYMAAREEDGTIAGLIERQFGPFLRWRPGDPDPRVNTWRARHDEAVAELAQLEALRAAGEEHSWDRMEELRGIIKVAKSWLD